MISTFRYHESSPTIAQRFDPAQAASLWPISIQRMKENHLMPASPSTRPEGVECCGKGFERTVKAMPADDDFKKRFESCPFRFRIFCDDHMEKEKHTAFLHDLLNLDLPIDFRSYTEQCKRYHLCGRPVSAKFPDYFFRFVDAKDFVDRLQVGGAVAESDDEDVVAWHSDFQQLSGVGRSQYLSSTNTLLARMDHPVFATFSRSAENDPIGELNGDVTAIRDVLGLPQTRMMLCLKYQSKNVRSVRFPTLADAGTHRFFHPAPSGAEYGWTWNLRIRRQLPLLADEKANPNKSLPEVVHQNEPTSIVADIIIFARSPGPLPASLPDFVPYEDVLPSNEITAEVAR